MSTAARGTLLTILMMLAEAISDAVTEQWLDFKKMVEMGTGGMCVCSALQQACTATTEKSDEWTYLGGDTKERHAEWRKAEREKRDTIWEVTVPRAVEENMKMAAAYS